jgi:hypothetical protein
MYGCINLRNWTLKTEVNLTVKPRDTLCWATEGFVTPARRNMSTSNIYIYTLTIGNYSSECLAQEWCQISLPFDTCHLSAGAKFHFPPLNRFMCVAALTVLKIEVFLLYTNSWMNFFFQSTFQRNLKAINEYNVKFLCLVSFRFVCLVVIAKRTWMVSCIKRSASTPVSFRDINCCTFHLVSVPQSHVATLIFYKAY